MDLRLPPPPNEADVRKTIWQLWFAKITRMFNEVYLELLDLRDFIIATQDGLLFAMQRPQYRSKTGLPVLSEQPLGTWSMWRNNADGTFRIVVRDSLGLRAFELTPLNPI